MTDTKFDDLPWLDETPPESAEAPLSEEAKRSLETERLEHERHAVMEEGRDEAFSEIMRRGRAITAIACNGDQDARETWKAEGALAWSARGGPGHNIGLLVIDYLVCTQLAVASSSQERMDFGMGASNETP
jgi:hypothetical protein